MNKYELMLIGPSHEEAATLEEGFANGRCQITCHYRERSISAEADDYFDALCAIRVDLEQEQLLPVCYGASLNVFPSRMAREMSCGRKAYRLQTGRKTSVADMVDIFAAGADIVPATVAQQKAFFESWSESSKA